MIILANASNPLVPQPFDVASAVLFALITVLPFIALISILKNTPGNARGRFLAIVLVFLIPLLGPLGWFAMLARDYARSRAG